LGLAAPDNRKAFYAGWDAAIEQALTPGEPVAYMHCPSVAMDGKVRPVLSFEKYEGDYASGIYAERIPLFTAPQPQREWVSLTDDEISDLWLASISGPLTATKFARAIERAHGIGGQE
jgi:hypothetical protein